MLMQIDGTPPIVPQTPVVQDQVGMPPMATPPIEVAKATTDSIFSALPTLQILPGLHIIDNFQGGVNETEEKAEEKDHAEKANLWYPPEHNMIQETKFNKSTKQWP